MGVTSALAVYFIIWWLVFFAVLPFGVRTQDEDEVTVAGTVGSAPSAPRLLVKVAVTTVIAALIFGGLYLLVTRGGLSLDDIPFLPDVRPEGWEPSWKQD